VSGPIRAREPQRCHFARRKVLATALGLLIASTAGVRGLSASGEGISDALARARALIDRNAFAEALATAQDAERASGARFGADDLSVAKAQLLIAEVYENLARYDDARALYEQSLRTHERILGPEDAALGAVLNALSRLASRMGKYAEAETLCQRALTIREKVLGRDHVDYAASLFTLGNLKRKLGHLDEAEPLLRRAIEIREKELGPDHPDVAQSLSAMAVLLREQNKQSEARQLLGRSMAINTKVYGPEHLSIADDLNSLGNLDKDVPDLKAAEAHYQRSLEIRERILGPDHPRVADSLNNLAIVYEDQGRETEEEQALRRCLAIREKALGPDHTDVAASLNNLGVFYFDLCRYREAEDAYRRSLAIREKAYGPDHPEVATSLGNLSNVYGRQSKGIESERLRRRALEITEKAFGPNHPEVATPLNNLALAEWALGHPRDSEAHLRRAITIWEAQLGPQHPFTGVGYRNLAKACSRQDKLAEAETFAKLSVETLAKAWGEDHPETLLSRFELASLYQRQRRFDEAEPLLRHCLETCERALPPDHVYASDTLMGLARLLYATGRLAPAAETFDQSLAMLQRQLDYHFGYMSEADRLTFISEIDDFVEVFLSFYLAERERDAAAVEKLYDVTLWRKGFVMGSLVAMRARLTTAADPEAQAMLNDLSAKKTRLANNLMTTPDDAASARQETERLAHAIQDLETALARRSSALPQTGPSVRATWRDVQQALAPDEAAVELVHIRQHDGSEWTGRARYIALILTKQAQRPILVDLGDAEGVERDALGEQDRLVRQGPSRRLEHPPAADGALETGGQSSLYDRIVRPVLDVTGLAGRVFVSPDGLLNRVAWNMASLPAGGGRLLDRFDLRVVSSTRDLLAKHAESSARSAVLVGNPDFGLAAVTQRGTHRRAASVADDSLQQLSSDLRSLPASGVTPLPFTQAELTSIQARLTRQGWKVQVLSGAAAAKEAVMAVKAPRLLHLATHGFFLPDQARAETETLEGFVHENPLLRSGLLFSGAARAFSGAGPSDGDDGILTAYEAASLDLHGTELVTLSACETGLGEMRNGEGVFGLRRSFQVAGAEAVLMSLWAVPDRETKELMTLFYGNWLAGQDKHEALRHAQIALREKVRKRYGSDLPYYWGGFVLVGL
jgi:CHAT domain-containing protein/Tfp pilus assembly protein PilF